MPNTLSQIVKDNLEKCRSATIAAVEAYNRPGPRFRTAQYLIMIIIAWNALFHAIIYHRGKKPWFKKKTSGTGKGVRYIKIDGEPKHWDLQECLKQYYEADNPPERKNLEFLIGLRNKIEHRHLPELDASLYGECQSALLNLEELIVDRFGAKYAMAEQLAVSLQFTKIIPSEKKKAAKLLASGTVKTVADYIEKFRGGLPSTVLNSQKYSFNVFLIPKVANRKSIADASVEFIHIDEANQPELERLEKLNVLIKEKHIPIANLNLYKPSQVLNALESRVPYEISMSTHTEAWRYYKVRPASNASHPERTRPEYCVFNSVHGDYLYTDAWTEKLVLALSDPIKFKEITGKDPITHIIH
jgi:hypothetical protein